MNKSNSVSQIGPMPASTRQQKARGSSRVELAVAVLLALYNWLLGGFVSLLVLSGVVWNTTTSRVDLAYGQSPLLGTYAISGTNDEPYSDRMLVCRLRSRMYTPAQLSVVLQEPTTLRVAEASGSTDVFVHGYRVVTRHEVQLEAQAAAFYTNTCETLTATLDAIFDSCTALGYNITRDAALRIVDGVASNEVSLIPNALPVLVMPYWDNALYAHYVIPSWDGSTCAFRLSGKYDSAAHAVAFLYSVERELRERKTIEWLQRPGGTWRHGWYEDTEHVAWYSDISTLDPTSPLGVQRRQFDTLANRELDCARNVSACPDVRESQWRWGKLSVSVMPTDTLSIVISNGARYGLFLYRRVSTRVSKSVYDLETFISNTTIVLLLFRWMMVMATLQSSYWRRKCPRWEHAGIGCLSSPRGSLFLPIVLLPRLKYSLTAFFSVGCSFEGEQLALAESPFVVYPCIVEVVLYAFSLVNVAARVLQRRVTDAFFGPALLFFCVLHHQRMALAQTGWFEFDGRITTVVASAGVNTLTLLDFVTTDIALHLNGNVKSIFALKLVVLALNALPLACGTTSTARRSVGVLSVPARGIEKTLATRACCSGGLGRSSSMYETPTTRLVSGGTSSSSSSPRSLVLPNYELLRLGYMVLGDEYLLHVYDWYSFLLLGILRSTKYEWLSSFRVVLVRVRPNVDDGYEIAAPPA